MAVTSPPPIEVNNFKFIQLRKLKVIENKESVPSDVINLVATSSRHGLIFVGLQDGFKVLKVENILDLDEDKQNFRIPAENYACQKVLSPPPVLISLNADDMTLAVCVIRNSRLVADMYDIRAFADPVSARLQEDEVPLPFINVQLSSQCTELKDFMWNPVVSEMYAFCLGNGEVHVHELAETILKIIADLPPATGATSVCWSPKGKQLVLGKRDGSLSQYKPTLQEVKKIPPPVLDENNLEVLKVCWLSTTLFATVYVPTTNDPDKAPSLVFVSTPKGVPVSYINCGDVCFGTTSTQTLRYTMHHQAEWGMLICTSSTSLESAVAGNIDNDKSVWIQWLLEDSGRAELPLDRNKESYALGMGIIYCPQRRIMISDVESYPPMPLFFLLSSSGLLCPFHMLYTRPGAANLVFPSEPICRDGERKRQGTPLATSPPNYALQSHIVTAASTPLSFGISRMDNSSLSALGTNAPNMNSIQIGGQISAPPVLSPQVFQHVAPPPVMPTLAVSPQGIPELVPQFQHFASTPKQVIPSEPAVFGLRPFATPPTSGPFLASSFINQPTETSYLPPAPTFTPPLGVLRPPETDSVTPKPTIVAVERSVAEDSKKAEISSLDTEKYTAAIIDEVCHFEKELLDLKSKVFDFHIGNKKEMTYLKKNLLLLADFDKELNDKMQALNLDVHDLKTASLESFSMIGEAKSRQQRRNDPNYNLMLQDRALDPINAKRRCMIQKHYQYLICQLQETDERLNQDLAAFSQKQRLYEKNIKQVQSSEAIYQTVINNQNIIRLLMMNFQTLTDLFHRQAKKKTPRLNYSLNSIDSSEINLSQLAESLLQDKPMSDTDLQNENFVRPVRKKFSANVQSALRDALAHRKITCVRPTVIEHPSQSRLLSSTLIQMDRKKFNVDASTETMNDRETLIDDCSIQRDSSSVINTTIPTPPLEVKPLSAFTATNAHPRIIGGITQGIPIASGLARPIPNSIPQVTAGSQDMKSVASATSTAVAPFFQTRQVSNMYEDITPPSSPEKSFHAANEVTGITQAGYMISCTPVINSNARTDGITDQSILGSSLISGSSRTPFPTASHNVIFTPVTAKFSQGNVILHEKTSNALESTVDFIANSVENFSFNQGKSTSQSMPSSNQTLTHIKIIDETKTPEAPVQKSFSNVFTTISENNVNSKTTTPFSMSKVSTDSSLFGRPPVFSVSSLISQPLQTSNTQVLKETASSNNIAHVETEIPLSNNSASIPFRSTAPVFGQQIENVQATGSSIFGKTFEHLTLTTPITTTTTKPPIPTTSSILKYGFSSEVPSSGLPTALASSSVLLATSPDVQKTEPPSVLQPQISTPNVFARATSTSSTTDNTALKPSFTFGQPTCTLSSSPFGQALTGTAASKALTVPIAEPVSDSSTPFVHATVADTTTKSLPTFGQVPETSPGFHFDPRGNTVTTPQFSIPFGQAVVTTSPNSSFSPTVTNTTTTTSSISFSQTETTTSTVSLFGQTRTTSAISPFCQIAATTTTSTISPFNHAAATTTPVSPFGQTITTTVPTVMPFSLAATTTIGPFNQTANITTSVVSSFNETATTTTPAIIPFGQTTTPSTVSPSFGQTTTPSTVSPFGQVTTTTTTSTVSPSLSFGQPVTTSSPVSPFGQTPAAAVSASPFKTPTTSTPSIFGQIPSGNSFNQNTTLPFVQTTVSPNATPFSQTGFLGVATPGSLFGQKDQTNTSIFGGQSAASGFSFGKPSSFGQSPTGSFGLAKAVFGQTPTSPSATFGQSGDSSMFQQGGFLGGLGGKPNDQNASKNFFGSISASSDGGNTGLFGSQGAATFGSKPAGSFSGGNFSTSGGGSVAQSGFGAFQQSQQKPAGFGASASFGSSPAFGGGSPPAFGTPSSFGSSQSTSPFGTAQSSFSLFASADAPTFGSLASQTGSSFTSLSPQPSPFQGNLFGNGNLFGGGAANTPPFGSPTQQQQQQQSGFGSPSSSGGSSAFSQWRS